MPEYDDDVVPNACPYCGREDGCEHFLLLIDLTFREAMGGELWEDFQRRWTQVWNAESETPDFDEREAFDRCVEEVDDVAGPGTSYDFEGGPGQSAEHLIFFLPSKQEVEAAASAYRKVVDPE